MKDDAALEKIELCMQLLKKNRIIIHAKKKWKSIQNTSCLHKLSESEYMMIVY